MRPPRRGQWGCGGRSVLTVAGARFEPASTQPAGRHPNCLHARLLHPGPKWLAGIPPRTSTFRRSTDRRVAAEPVTDRDRQRRRFQSARRMPGKRLSKTPRHACPNENIACNRMQFSHSVIDTRVITLPRLGGEGQQSGAHELNGCGAHGFGIRRAREFNGADAQKLRSAGAQKLHGSTAVIGLVNHCPPGMPQIRRRSAGCPQCGN